MERKKLIKFNKAFILGIVYLLAGVFFIQSDVLSFLPRWYEVALLTLLPAIFLFVISQVIDKKRRMYIVSLALLFAFFFIVVQWYFFQAIFGCVGPYTDINYYNLVIEENRANNALRLFPQSIPADAKDIIMKYSRGMMQSKPYCVLKYKANVNEIEDLKKKYSFRRGSGYERGTNSALKYTSLPVNEFPEMYMYTEYEQKEKFVEKYGDKILFYETDFSEYRMTYNKGIVIIPESGEVVFWYFVEPL